MYKRQEILYYKCNLLFNSIKKNLPASTPFHLLSTEATLDVQKHCAEIFVADKVSGVSESPPLVKNTLANRKIKLGYFSADFREHPVGILLDNLVLGHDRNRYEVIGYFLNQGTGDPVESHLLKIFDKTYNLSKLDDLEAYDLVLKEELDIAVDLNVHTADGHYSGSGSASIGH